MSDRLNAVGWDSELAARFGERCASSPTSCERRAVWIDLIARFGGPSVNPPGAGCGGGILIVGAPPRTCAGFVGIDPSP